MAASHVAAARSARKVADGAWNGGAAEGEEAGDGGSPMSQLRQRLGDGGSGGPPPGPRSPNASPSSGSPSHSPTQRRRGSPARDSPAALAWDKPAEPSADDPAAAEEERRAALLGTQSQAVIRARARATAEARMEAELLEAKVQRLEQDLVEREKVLIEGDKDAAHAEELAKLRRSDLSN